MIPPNYGKLFIKLLQTNTNFELVNDKQKKTTDGPEIANIFNKFFSTVIHNGLSNCLHQNNKMLCEFLL